jgi:hypothetical protein
VLRKAQRKKFPAGDEIFGAGCADVIRKLRLKAN